MPLLQSKYALVTGATSGIGKEIALTFAREGAQVFAIGTSQEKASLLQKEVDSMALAGTIHIRLANISDQQSIKALFTEMMSLFPRLDILVNNAGITKDGLLLRMSEADIDAVLNVNLKSCFFTCQEALRPMMKARSGRIINISSIVGMTGNAGQTNYAAAKAGMIGFSKSLAKEVGSRNIMVNCIAPGFIETHMTDHLSEERKQKALESIPLGRLGSVTDIANASLFLASDLAQYITGQVLVVDGGLSMGF